MKLIIKNKVMDLSDVGKFVYNMYGEGLIHKWSVCDERGEIRCFVDKEGIEYKILYKRNEHFVYIPKEILQICVRDN